MNTESLLVFLSALPLPFQIGAASLPLVVALTARVEGSLGGLIVGLLGGLYCGFLAGIFSQPLL